MNNNSAYQNKIEALEQLLDVQEKSIIEQTEKLYNEIETREKAEKQLQQSNAELEMSEKRYRTLFDSAAEGILVAGIQSKKFKFANPAICHLLGYTQEELLQLDVSAIHPKEALAHVNAEFEAQARGEKMLAEALPCLLKNGAVIYADVKATQMVIDNESCIVGFFSDITERKRMEKLARERARERQVFYGLSEAAGREGITLEELYQEVTNILPPSSQYPKIACARIVIGDSEYRTKNFMDSAWKLSAPVKVYKSVVGRIDIGYLEKRPELDEGPFLKEERQLIDAVAERLGHIAERRRAEEMLLLKNIVFETSIAANSVADTNGIIAEANDAFLRVWGYSNKDEVIGKSLPHFFQKSEEAVAIVTALNKSGRWAGEFSARRKDGSLFNAYGLATDIKDSTGKLIGYQAAVMDITERRRAEEDLRQSEEKFRGILNNMKDVVWSISWPDFTPLFISPSVEELYGISRHDFMNNPSLFKDITHPDDQNLTEKAMKQLIEKGESAREVRIVKPGGSIVWIYDKSRIIYDKNHQPVRIEGLAQDITERKMYQEQLERKNREILEFTDIVTHDLKKPLAIMKNICSLVANESVCTLKEDGREAISMAKDAIGYMHELLEDLLACAKLEAGTQALEFENIDSGELLVMVLQRFKLQAEEKNITITKNVSGNINADRKGMTKVFMNLIGNAVNYIGAPANPEIIISSSNKKTDGSTLFSIKDNGIGIPADVQKDIFRKFKRGTNVGGISGTGLGLSIVKGIVEVHGGKIWLDSKEGEGTCFYFTIPAAVHEK